MQKSKTGALGRFQGALKRSQPHNVYLCRKTIDITIALKTCVGTSRYLLPSQYHADAPISRATFNRVTYSAGLLSSCKDLPHDWQLHRAVLGIESW